LGVTQKASSGMKVDEDDEDDEDDDEDPARPKLTGKPLPARRSRVRPLDERLSA